jgi:glucan 1,3-beta-glucosidase
MFLQASIGKSDRQQASPIAISQQFTAKNLQFTSCLTAIKQQWNWGFTWKNIYVLSCYIAIDCTAYSGITDQGTGSITVLDSHFNGVPYAITIADLVSRGQPSLWQLWQQ